MKPMMTESDMKTIERILDAYPSVSVLEWGSGGSTVYFPNYLRKNNTPYSWLSIEYNTAWYQKISAATENDPHTEIVLFDTGNAHVKQRENPMDEYVAYPSTLGKTFDVILIDGRKRRRCILEAKQLLNPNGVVLLHDAQRRYYHCAFDAYPYSRMITKHIWSGKQEAPSIAIRLSNWCRYWYFYLRTALRSFLSRHT